MIKYAYEVNGFLPYWTPRKATNISLPKCVEDLSKLGYQGVELMGAWAEQIVAAYGNIDKFKEHLKANKMELAGVYYSDMFHDRSRWPNIMDYVEGLAAFLKECGSSNLIVGTPGRRTVGWIVTDEHIATIAECFQRMAARTLKYGVKPTIHPHYETTIERRSELDKLMAITEPTLVGLCIDTAQLFVAGEDGLDAIKTYKDRINYLHFKDAKEVVVRGEVLIHRKRLFYEVGQGKVDFSAIMNILKDMKYDGWVVIECDHPDLTPTPLESARMTKEYIDKVLSKIYK